MFLIVTFVFKAFVWGCIVGVVIIAHGVGLFELKFGLAG